MQATEILSQEHRVIEQVLNCWEKLIEQARSTGRCDWWAAAQMLRFFRDFADRCHHGMEEDRLFPRLEAHGFSPVFGPTGVMRAEHEQGRRYLATVKRAIEAGARGDSHAAQLFVNSAASYLELLRAHIKKEDHCLFPMADQAHRAEEQEQLVQEFAEAEHRQDFEGMHQEYLELADELADKFGVERLSTAACGGCCGHH
jgi:hemerythrin-like domain-containing protein